MLPSMVRLKRIMCGHVSGGLHPFVNDFDDTSNLPSCLLPLNSTVRRPDTRNERAMRPFDPNTQICCADRE